MFKYNTRRYFFSTYNSPCVYFNFNFVSQHSKNTFWSFNFQFFPHFDCPAHLPLYLFRYINSCFDKPFQHSWPLCTTHKSPISNLRFYNMTQKLEIQFCRASFIPSRGTFVPKLNVINSISSSWNS
jgi:hypothetical protein